MNCGLESRNETNIYVERQSLCCVDVPSGSSWQVFHVPLEERRYKDNSQFGEGDEAKVCVDIMQKTGAHIELSLAKDQGLSIMVTGKLDSVMKARKEIVARLQTQVGAPLELQTLLSLCLPL